MRVAGYVVLALLVAVPAGALAVDPPHDETVRCSGCHLGHNAMGGSLTSSPGNANLCQSCHSPPSGNGPTGHGFPWADADQAVPGVRGRSHSWSGNASNMGATPPQEGSGDPVEAAMGKYLDGASLKCTTCHDAHQADAVALSGRGKLRASPPEGPAGGTISVISLPSGLEPKSYVIRITFTGDVGTARFRVSNDRRISWSGEYTSASDVQLTDMVHLRFEGTFAQDNEYTFHASYPFLRVDNTASAMCVVCHRDRNQFWQDVEGGTENGGPPGRLPSISLGTTVFHHPVGQSLDSNGMGYDRTAGVLDANGATQAVGDGNASNDLSLGDGNVVHCMTCHSPHNADSNSITEDGG